MSELLERITFEPGKASGEACIRGMRVRVKDVLEMLGDGMSSDEILADYPYLEADDIRAALAFAGVSGGGVVNAPFKTPD